MNPSPLFEFSTEDLLQLGIGQWGYTTAKYPLSYLSFVDWIKAGNHGPLIYLSDARMEKRSNFKNVFSSYESALVFLFPYTDSKKNVTTNNKIAGFATGFEGSDYHDTIRRNLNHIEMKLKEIDPSLLTMLTVDIEPILERDLAYQAGLGWIGKNSMLIHPVLGSFFLIGSILLSKNLDLDQKKVNLDFCGQCQQCLPACPTNAILAGKRQILASQCISTFTIEQFKPVEAPPGIENSDYQMFGCDICQDVCPWNKKPLVNLEPKKFALSPKLELITSFFLDREASAILEDLSKMSNREYKRIFSATSLARTGRIGMMKNIAASLDPLRTSKKFPD